MAGAAGHSSERVLSLLQEALVAVGLWETRRWCTQPSRRGRPKSTLEGSCNPDTSSAGRAAARGAHQIVHEPLAANRPNKEGGVNLYWSEPHPPPGVYGLLDVVVLEATELGRPT